MKPIFERERQFLNQQLNVDLPHYTWRKASKIYLNANDKIPLYEIKAVQGALHIVKNNYSHTNDDGSVVMRIKDKEVTVVNLTIDQEYEQRKEHLHDLFERAVEQTMACIREHEGFEFVISLSGGKDSSLLLYVMREVYKRLDIDMVKATKPVVFNTSNDTAQTYRQIKHELKDWIDPLIPNCGYLTHKEYSLAFNLHIKDYIISPEKGWYSWLKEDKDWFLPSIQVRNCCSKYKEGVANKLYGNGKDYAIFMGVRSQESTKRAYYEFDLNAACVKNNKKTNVKPNMHRYCPIVDYHDIDVWLTILHENIKVNDMYEYGYNRCGCLICPFATDYTDILTTTYYPHLRNKWNHACDQNYKLKGVASRLKWSEDEWRQGRWKHATSKEYELLTRKKTPERITAMAELKGISNELAEKYWDKNTCGCGKRLNCDEVAFNLKTYGRYEGVDDTRIFKCRSCLCSELHLTVAQYNERVIEFRHQECNLF